MFQNLQLLREKPNFSASALLTIDALAPLSLVTSMPGKYYRGQPEPTDDMLYGLLENALGWHLTGKTDTARDNLVNQMARKHNLEAQASGVGFKSLLQFHVRFACRYVPSVVHYDDYWAQHLRGGSFFEGSREYDYRAIALMNAKRAGHIAIEDKSEERGFSKDPAKLYAFQDGDGVHPNVLRPYFPQYYASPTPRGYVLPSGPYCYRIETSAALSYQLAQALENPAAPLYLGSSDGWVEVSYEELEESL